MLTGRVDSICASPLDSGAAMAGETGNRDRATPLSRTDVKRRGLLRFGTLITAFTGASAISAIGASSAEAGPGDKTSPTADVPISEKGAPLGVATLDTESRIPRALLPDLSSTYVGKESQAVNVKDYGAKGDSVTDDHAAITAAIAGCPLGSTLFFPRGTYLTSQEILLNRNINLLGVGISRNSGTRLNSGSIIRFTSNAAQNASTALLRVTASFGDIESIALFGRGSAQAPRGSTMTTAA